MTCVSTRNTCRPGKHQAVHAGVHRHVLLGARAAAQALADHLVDVVPGALAVLCPRCRTACRRPRPCAAAWPSISVSRRRISILATCTVMPLRSVMQVVGLPEVAVAMVLLDVARRRSPSPGPSGAGRSFSHRRWAMTAGRPISVGRARPLVHHHLHGTQHALLLAFGSTGHPLAALAFLAMREDRLHRRCREAYTKPCSFSR